MTPQEFGAHWAQRHAPPPPTHRLSARFAQSTNQRRGVISAPTVSNGLVYVGSYDDYVYPLDAIAGKVRWKMPTGDNVGSSPSVANDLVYVGSQDGNVHAFVA